MQKIRLIQKPESSTPRGPKPEVLKIDGDWQEAIKRSLEKKKPADGWPKEHPNGRLAR
jgi:hypothetical protein